MEFFYRLNIFVLQGSGFFFLLLFFFFLLRGTCQHRRRFILFSVLQQPRNATNADHIEAIIYYFKSIIMLYISKKIVK